VEWDLVFWLAALFILMPLMFIPFLLFPRKLISWQGHFYRRWYKGYLEMPDEVIDKFPRLPTDTYLVGSRSHYINRAPEHPEEFPRAIRALRSFGWMLAGMWALAVALLIWGAATGRLMIAR
jgi:hypothetical protein